MAATAILCLSSCIVIERADREPAVRADRESEVRVRKEYSIEGFSAIETSAMVDVKFVQTRGREYAVRAEGPENIVALLSVRKEDGVLKVGLKKHSYVTLSNTSLNITVCAPEMTGLKANGSSEIEVESLHAPNLVIETSGAGEVEIKQLDTDRLSVVSHGASDVKLAGRAHSASFSSSGSSSIKAADLEAADVEVKASGSSDIQCHATKTIRGSASGSSDIKYKGSPAVKDFGKTGSSEISRIG